MDRRRKLAILALCALQIKIIIDKRKRLRERKCLARRNNNRRVFNMIHNELRLEDENSFRNYLRMDEDCFKELLTLIESSITHADTCTRQSIPAHKRLSIALRFLATGKTFQSLSYSTRISRNTIELIVVEVLKAITDRLNNEHLKIPKCESEWLEIAKRFYSQWNFPNCIGALDGKHIVFRPPRSSGSFFRTYNGTDSVVLLALVSADYKFLAIDIGMNGRISDGGVFGRCLLSNPLRTNQLNIPPATPLPGRHMDVPYVIIADDAFPLMEYIMKPYKSKELSKEQRIYNHRMCPARRTVENAFGMLSNRFRIFLKPINLNVEKVELITKAACILHNFLLAKSTNYLPTDEEIVNCTLRNTIQQGGDRTTNAALAIRNEFQEYFNTTGQVSWQKYVS